jgi:eukaryotic-like serine/threonine-protein kinase
LLWPGDMTLHADPLHLVGTRIAGRYQVDALVDETNLSIVYRATQLVWRRSVALKVFKGASGLGEGSRAELLAAFVREGALLGELSEMSSAICQARDVGFLTTPEGAWMPYMALEWLEGDSLEVILLRERERGSPPRTARQTAELLRPIADALACAHARGVVHCDVKPGNIVVLRTALRGQTRCKLLDFGIAKVASQARSPASSVIEKAFTPGYGAPEQFEPERGPTGPWTDVYALALVAVEMMCGREALRGGHLATLARSSCDPASRPTPRARGLAVSDAIEDVFRRALAVRPADRTKDMRAFWADFSRAARPRLSRPKRLPRFEQTIPFDLRRLRRRSRRGTWRSAVVLATVAAAVALGAPGFPSGSRLSASVRGGSAPGATRATTLATKPGAHVR